MTTDDVDAGGTSAWSQIARTVTFVGGFAAVFYAVGFTTVQSYVYRHRLDGMLWFTSDFYRDAGAKFLLEFVRTPLIAWYVFFPYLIILYQLVPKDPVLRLSWKADAPVSPDHWLRVAGLFTVMALTYLGALFYDRILEWLPAARAAEWLFVHAADGEALQTAQSLGFFNMVAPVVIVVGGFLIQFRASLSRDPGSRRAYGLMAASYIVFLAILPISYGFHLYDWRIVPVREPESLARQFPEGSQSSPALVWLLGEFGDKYIFLTKQDGLAGGVLQAVAVDQIKLMNLEPSRSVSLKQHLEASAVMDGGVHDVFQFMVQDASARHQP